MFRVCYPTCRDCLLYILVLTLFLGVVVLFQIYVTLHNIICIIWPRFVFHVSLLCSASQKRFDVSVSDTNVAIHGMDGNERASGGITNAPGQRIDEHHRTGGSIANVPIQRIDENHRTAGSIANVPIQRMDGNHDKSRSIANVPIQRIDENYRTAGSIANMPIPRIDENHRYGSIDNEQLALASNVRQPLQPVAMADDLADVDPMNSRLTPHLWILCVYFIFVRDRSSH